MTTLGPCPPEQRIAAFVDGTLDATERVAVAQHVDRCVACFDLVATLGLQAGQPPPAVDAALRDAAEATRHQPPVVRRLLPAMSAAAAVLVAVVWWNSPRQPAGAGRTTAPTVASPAEPADASRSSGGGLVVVQEPHEGDAINGGQLVRWNGPPEATSYEVYMSTAAGDVVFKRQVEGTEHQLRLDVSLPPSDAYYFWVAAYLPEGRRIPSNVVRIRVAPAR